MDLAELLSTGEQALKAAIADQQTEHLSLDFKEPGNGDGALFKDGKITKQGQRVIGEAISAFANSAGGILVIGVRCKALAGVDAASELVPVEALSRCYSSLSGQLGAMLQPRHDGLRLHSIRAQGDQDLGYLIVEVPRSERRPHMAQLQGHYFKRSSSSSFRMEHYDIEDAFRRFTSPTLEMKFELTRRMMIGREKAQFRVELALHNSSDVSAFAPHIVVDGPREGGQFSIEAEHEITRFRNSTTLATNADFVIHPHQTKSIGRVVFWAFRDAENNESLGSEQGGRGDFIQVDFTVSAKDMRPVPGRFNFDVTTIRSFWA